MARKKKPSGPGLDFDAEAKPAKAKAETQSQSQPSTGTPYYLAQRPVKFINVRVDVQFRLDCKLWQKIDFDNAQRADDGHIEKLPPEILVFPC